MLISWTSYYSKYCLYWWSVKTRNVWNVLGSHEPWAFVIVRLCRLNPLNCGVSTNTSGTEIFLPCSNSQRYKPECAIAWVNWGKDSSCHRVPLSNLSSEFDISFLHSECFTSLCFCTAPSREDRVTSGSPFLLTGVMRNGRFFAYLAEWCTLSPPLPVSKALTQHISLILFIWRDTWKYILSARSIIF